MSTTKEIIIGTIAGLIIGLPQGMSDLPIKMGNHLPNDTILIIGAFGGIVGIIIGMKLLSRASTNEYSIGGYFFFLIGTLSIGVPTIIRHYNYNFVQDLTMPGLFFTSIGSAMILGGIISHFFSKST